MARRELLEGDCVVCYDRKGNWSLYPGRYRVKGTGDSVCGRHLAEYLRRAGKATIEYQED